MNNYENINNGFNIILNPPIDIIAEDGIFKALSGIVNSTYEVDNISVSVGANQEFKAEFTKCKEHENYHTVEWKALIQIENSNFDTISVFAKNTASQEDLIFVKPINTKQKYINRQLKYFTSTSQNHVEVENKSQIKINKKYDNRLPTIYPNYLNLINSKSSDYNLNGKKICIAAIDIVGPIKNGGIGTFNYSLAELLCKSGAEVTVLWLHGSYLESESLTFWIEYFKNKNIQFIPLEIRNCNAIASHWRSISLSTFEWLKNKDFDFIYFSEMCGSAYDSLMAKKFSQHFNQSKLIIITHSSSKWHKYFNNELIDTSSSLELDFLEKQSVALADLVISPSQYLLNWCVNDNWKMPEKVLVLPYPVMSYLIEEKIKLKDKYKEICFFGRLESRKGLELFCNAIDKLSLEIKDIVISFMGKETTIDGLSSKEYITKRSKLWNLKYRIFTNFSQTDALSYLKEGDKLAVVASISDNSPFTIYECLNLGIPIIASNAGGIPELFKSNKDIFNLTTESLYQSLKNKLSSKPTASEPLNTQIEIHKAWINLHNDKRITESIPEKFSNHNFSTSVIIVTDNYINSLKNLQLNKSFFKDIFFIDRTKKCFVNIDHSILTVENFKSKIKNSAISHLLMIEDGVSLYDNKLNALYQSSVQVSSEITSASIDLISKAKNIDEVNLKLYASNYIPDTAHEKTYSKAYCIFGEKNKLLSNIDYLTLLKQDPCSEILNNLKQKETEWACIVDSVGSFNSDINIKVPSLYVKDIPHTELPSTNDQQSLISIKNRLNEVLEKHINPFNPQVTNLELDNIQKFFNSKKIIKNYYNKDFNDVILVGGGKLFKNSNNNLNLQFEEEYISIILDLNPNIYTTKIMVYIEAWFSHFGNLSFGFNDFSTQSKERSYRYTYLGLNKLFYSIDVKIGKPIIIQFHSKKGEFAEISKIQLRE